jgi:hypothetical protein
MNNVPGIDEVERKISFMGEYLLGSVRAEGENSWHWMMDEDTLCLYGRDVVSGLRILQVLSPQEDGGANGHRFLFNTTGILQVLNIQISGRELAMPGLQDYLLTLHRLEGDLGETEITDVHRQTFQQALQAPLQ